MATEKQECAEESEKQQREVKEKTEVQGWCLRRKKEKIKCCHYAVLTMVQDQSDKNGKMSFWFYWWLPQMSFNATEGKHSWECWKAKTNRDILKLWYNIQSPSKLREGPFFQNLARINWLPTTTKNQNETKRNETKLDVPQQTIDSRTVWRVLLTYN